MADPQQTRRPLTIGALLDNAQGINLFCPCGHRTALLPAQLAELAHPQTRLLAFKRRFRCTMCGRSGARNDLRLEPFDASTPFVDAGELTQPKSPSRPLH